jgi:alpha-1,3-rhamnosyl/mannosyltransferase
MSPRRVGVNLLWLVPGVVGGSEEYTVRLLESFARLGDQGLELTLYVNQAFGDAHPELAPAYPTVVAPLAGPHKVRRVAAEATWLARQARQDGVDFVHHMGGNLLRAHPPGVVTVHDLQPFAQPGNFSVQKYGYLRATLPRALRRAVLVTTLTEHTRHDVHERMGVPLDDIVLVPPGIHLRGERDQAGIRRVRERYQLGEQPFFLYPAITYPHKNHITLVRAFAEVAARHPDCLLVLTGGSATGEAALVAEIDRSGTVERVRRPGRIPREDLDLLMDAATALTCPSTYEGFGIPVLEAMSRRCPVVASDATALPEVVGDAGLLVDALDVDGWAAAMNRLLDDPEEATELAARGRQRAERFSWERSGRALADAYDQVEERLHR